ISHSDARWHSRISSKLAYLPVPRTRRERNERPATVSGASWTAVSRTGAATSMPAVLSGTESNVVDEPRLPQGDRDREHHRAVHLLDRPHRLGVHEVERVEAHRGLGLERLSHDAHDLLRAPLAELVDELGREKRAEERGSL